MGSVLLLLSMHLFESELQTGFILKPKPGRDWNHKPKPGLTFAFEARFSPKRQIYWVSQDMRIYGELMA